MRLASTSTWPAHSALLARKRSCSASQRETSGIAHYLPTTDEPLDALRGQARREVNIRWKRGGAVPETPPDFLDLRERVDRQWRCVLTGPAPQLVQWLGRHPVEDITIGRPDLENLFRSYYRDP